MLSELLVVSLAHVVGWGVPRATRDTLKGFEHECHHQSPSYSECDHHCPSLRVLTLLYSSDDVTP